MSIRTKLALTLFVTVALFLGMDHVLRRESFFASFTALEQIRAQAEIDRTRAAFEELTEELTQQAERLVAADPGSEDDAAPIDVHMRIVIDEAGFVHHHRIANPKTGHAMRIREFPSERLSPGHPVPLAWLSEGPPSGLLTTHSGAMILGSAELDVGGRPGLLVIGRLLDAELLGSMRVVADSRFEFATVDTPGLDARDRAAFEDVKALDGIRIDEGADGTTVAYSTLRDIRSLPVALLRTPVAGGELALWKQLEQYEVLTSTAIAVIFPLILLILIQVMIVGPLTRLTEHATEIGRSDDSKMRLALERSDEIGRLADEFDGMLDKLERSRIEQQRTARFAGRSEVAVGVMHNVGNLANSVGVSAGIARDRFDSIDAADLRAVHDQLVEHRGQLDEYLAKDSRGKHLLQFLGALVDDLEKGVAQARDDAGCVVEDVRKITQLIQDLEDSKSLDESVERVDLAREVDAALRLALSSTGIEVEVVQDLASIPEFLVDRQRVLETLVAVMTNALEAMESTPITERFLVVCLDQPAPDRARIEIRDFGMGIERHQLQRIFAAGVTTKEDGSGFGLHLASLAATELGGQLSVASDGPGTGATFTLELPLPTDDGEAAASDGERDAA